eukprot:TRINITY_DN16331_c0_g1_i1.p3 TRINITY_DN16331_c0_g1~~TRINITY_DN16331_c0_g1_i1.p3  ORF type:complete len:136 (+),score=23.35 TRINITY_DN16331_c0_g1_i1:71-478(+)
MKKCKCRLPHNQAAITATIVHKPSKGPYEAFSLPLNKPIPKGKRKTVSDYPGLFKRIHKKDKVIQQPWHLMTEMTKWEFVPKGRPARAQPKYSANSEVPHSYYAYTSSIFHGVSEANDEAKIVDVYFNNSEMSVK